MSQYGSYRGGPPSQAGQSFGTQVPPTAGSGAYATAGRSQLPPRQYSSSSTDPLGRLAESQPQPATYPLSSQEGPARGSRDGSNRVPTAFPIPGAQTWVPPVPTQSHPSASSGVSARGSFMQSPRTTPARGKVHEWQATGSGTSHDFQGSPLPPQSAASMYNTRHPRHSQQSAPVPVAFDPNSSIDSLPSGVTGAPGVSKQYPPVSMQNVHVRGSLYPQAGGSTASTGTMRPPSGRSEPHSCGKDAPPPRNQSRGRSRRPRSVAPGAQGPFTDSMCFSQAPSRQRQSHYGTKMTDDRHAVPPAGDSGTGRRGDSVSNLRDRDDLSVQQGDPFAEPEKVERDWEADVRERMKRSAFYNNAEIWKGDGRSVAPQASTVTSGRPRHDTGIRMYTAYTRAPSGVKVWDKWFEDRDGCEVELDQEDGKWHRVKEKRR